MVPPHGPGGRSDRLRRRRRRVRAVPRPRREVPRRPQDPGGPRQPRPLGDRARPRPSRRVRRRRPRRPGRSPCSPPCPPTWPSRRRAGSSWWSTAPRRATWNTSAAASHGPEVLDDLLEQLGADVLVVGHTHAPMWYRGERGLVINPGSAISMPVVRTSRTFALLDLDAMSVHVSTTWRRRVLDVPHWS